MLSYLLAASHHKQRALLQDGGVQRGEKRAGGGEGERRACVAAPGVAHHVSRQESSNRHAKSQMRA